MAEETKFLEYKGHPLVRSGNMIFYGSLADTYVVMMLITSMKKSPDGEDIPGNISIELQYTDPAVPPKDRVVKRGERNGLYEALDLASSWLNQILQEQ